MQYLDQMEEEYAKAKELWNDFEGLCQPSIIPEPYDYKKAANEDSWKENK